MNPANVTISRGIFAIAGPKARKLPVTVIELPLGNGSFPQITVRTSNMQFTSDVRILRPASPASGPGNFIIQLPGASRETLGQYAGR